MPPLWTLLPVAPVAVGETQRVDRVLQRALSISRREARLLIAAGRVRVQSKLCRIATRPLAPHQRVEFLSEPQAKTVVRAPTAPLLRVLYQDTWIAVVAKPAGLLSETDRFGAPSVETELPALLSKHPHREQLWLVHRLDAGTSGVMILARTPTAAHRLGDAFRLRQAHKRYLALVGGRAVGPVRLQGAIARVRGTRHGVSDAGRSADTSVSILQATDRASLVEATPHTGRTHQIRVHLTDYGHPLLGDRLYGGLGYSPCADRARIARPMLHAASLSLLHPHSNQTVTFAEAPPEDFQALATTLFEKDLPF